MNVFDAVFDSSVVIIALIITIFTVSCEVKNFPSPYANAKSVCESDFKIHKNSKRYSLCLLRARLDYYNYKQHYRYPIDKRIDDEVKYATIFSSYSSYCSAMPKREETELCLKGIKTPSGKEINIKNFKKVIEY